MGNETESEREVLLVGGPRDGQPVRYRTDYVQALGMDGLSALVNTPQTRMHAGRYILRRYAHETGVLELFVWFADGEDD